MGFKFKDNKLLLNHSLISPKTILTLVKNSVELGLIVVALVSLVYNTNVAFSDVIMEKSFISNKMNKGPRIDPCGMPYWTSSQLE
jgi:hypothetical protein